MPPATNQSIKPFNLSVNNYLNKIRAKRFSPQEKTTMAIAAGALVAGLGLGYATYKNWDRIITLFDFSQITKDIPVKDIPVIDNPPIDIPPIVDPLPINEEETSFVWGKLESLSKYFKETFPETLNPEPAISMRTKWILIAGFIVVKILKPSFLSGDINSEFLPESLVKGVNYNIAHPLMTFLKGTSKALGTL